MACFETCKTSELWHKDLKDCRRYEVVINHSTNDGFVKYVDWKSFSTVLKTVRYPADWRISEEVVNNKIHEGFVD